MPQLVLTLVVRDEEELLEANLEYHLAQGVDAFMVTDHGSADRTPAILAGYERRGLAHVVRDDEPGHHQGRRATHMARLAHERFGACWLIHDDADEFWWPAAGSLQDVFAAIPERYDIVEVPRHDFRPAPQYDPGAPFHSQLTVRERRSLNPRGEPLEGKVAHRAHPQAVVAPGGHGVTIPDGRVAPPLPLLEVLHFPMRSFEQFERKVVATGTGYEALAERSQDVGRDQLALLELQRSGGLREYFEARVAGAGDGLVEDTRLARFIAGREGAAPPAPDESARRLVTGAFALHEQLEAAEAALAKARFDLEYAESQLFLARQELEGADAELEAAREEQERAVAALGALRGSRVIRATAPLRRAFYRLRARARRLS